MAAASLGLRKSGKSRAKSSNQGWSPNSGQAADDQSGSFVDVLVSERDQQSSSSGLTLPQQNQQAGSQTQSASSPDQLQNGSVQYQPSGNDLEPPTTETLGQYQPAGNNETSLAGDDLNSNVIVNAQLTHLISRDDAAQGQMLPMPQTFRCQTYQQCMISPLRDARLVEDAVSGASVQSLQQANANVLPALCAEHDSSTARHDSSNGVTAKPTITTYMHTVSMVDLGMIMNCIRRLPMIKNQLMQ